jgi:selenocysteine-specific elongation factor
VRFGYVDVPGHERFVKNMLAGAGGIDLVILVVAADEAVKPQTREHFEICRLLGLKHGLVAITKTDLADAGMLELARLELEELAAGSFLQAAPVVEVSAKSGAGLEHLKEALARVAAAVSERDSSGPLRLPVDRSFSLRGHGTIVTGTLWSGSIAPEDEVEAHPGGRRLRVRGVQVHGGPVPRALAGQRTALNLAGVETAELARGMTLTQPALFRSTKVLDCVFQLLPSAQPLKHRAPIHFHAGTAETEAEVRLLEGTDPVKPRATAYLRILLPEPMLLLPGDRFIARMFSPVVTIGGGTVLDNEPPERIKKPDAVSRLRGLEAAGLPDRVRLLVGESADGLTLAALARRTGALPGAVSAAGSAAGLRILKTPDPRLLSPAALHRSVVVLREALAQYHRDNPLKPGMPRAAAPLAGFLLEAALLEAKDVAAEGEVLRLVSHRLELRADEDAAAAKMEALFRDGGLAVPALNDVLAQSGVDGQRARQLVQLLLRNGRLVRVAPELLFHESAVAELKQMLAARKGTRFGVGEFKAWTGVSRKYAIPLLEWLDRERITRREGDQRQVL